MNGVMATVAWIQQQDPTTTSTTTGAANIPQVTPDPSGLPLEDAVTTILNIAAWLGVVAAILGVIYGGITLMMGDAAANSAWGSRGKTVALWSLVGGLIVASSSQLVSYAVGLQ